MYRVTGATVALKAWPIPRRYLTKEELVSDWWSVVARFFSFVRAANAGWQCKIDRRRQGYYYMFFYGYFLAVFSALVTCYGGHAQSTSRVRTDRDTRAINRDSSRRVFLSAVYIFVFFFCNFS